MSQVPEDDRRAVVHRRMTRFAEALGTALLTDDVLSEGMRINDEHLVVHDPDAADRLLDRLQIPKRMATPD